MRNAAIRTRRMLERRLIWAKRFSQLLNRPFCSNSKQPIATSSSTNNGGDKVSSSLSKQDAYKQLENLDFMKAAKILFSDPPKKKKFGIDFHLVQLFFACMPSLAVYLVAQYARYEMRRMEAEMEQKKQAEEAVKATELKDREEEAKATELKVRKEEAAAFPDLLEVKVRIEKLEEAIKDVVESKKLSGDPTKTSSADSSNRDQKAAKDLANIHDTKHAPDQTTKASHQGTTSGTTPNAASSSKS